MVKIVFYNLLRSKYNVKELQVKSGSIHNIIKQIMNEHPNMKIKDFETAVVFLHGKPIHNRGFDKVIEDNEELIFTHFVGGG